METQWVVVIDFFFFFFFNVLSPLFAARQSGRALEAVLQGLSICSAAHSIPAPGRCAGGQRSWVAIINNLHPWSLLPARVAEPGAGSASLELPLSLGGN